MRVSCATLITTTTTKKNTHFHRTLKSVTDDAYRDGFVVVVVVFGQSVDECLRIMVTASSAKKKKSFALDCCCRKIISFWFFLLGKWLFSVSIRVHRTDIPTVRTYIAWAALFFFFFFFFHSNCLKIRNRWPRCKKFRKCSATKCWWLQFVDRVFYSKTLRIQTQKKMRALSARIENCWTTTRYKIII